MRLSSIKFEIGYPKKALNQNVSDLAIKQCSKVIYRVGLAVHGFMKNTVSGLSVWSVYLVVCADGSFYTGVAKDVVARVEQHNRGAGAKYTRGRRPVELLFSEQVGDHGQALRREYAIKQLPRKQKMELIAAQNQSL